MISITLPEEESTEPIPLASLFENGNRDALLADEEGCVCDFTHCAMETTCSASNDSEDYIIHQISSDAMEDWLEDDADDSSAQDDVDSNSDFKLDETLQGCQLSMVCAAVCDEGADEPLREVQRTPATSRGDVFSRKRLWNDTPDDSCCAYCKHSSSKNSMHDVASSSQFHETWAHSNVVKHNQSIFRSRDLTERSFNTKVSGAWHHIGSTIAPDDISAAAGEEHDSVVNATATTILSEVRRDDNCGSQKLPLGMSCTTTSSTSRQGATGTVRQPTQKIVDALAASMVRSHKSQEMLHRWDANMGLKRSHSKVMSKSSKSRKQLQDSMKAVLAGKDKVCNKLQGRIWNAA